MGFRELIFGCNLVLKDKELKFTIGNAQKMILGAPLVFGRYDMKNPAILIFGS